MIRLDRVTVTYPGHARPTLHDVDLTIPEGELVLVAGRTGVGKSTLLGVAQRPGAALHRRPPAGQRHASTGVDTRTAAAARARRTWSAWSARTRSPGSSPTPSRRSSPTAWSSSASAPDIMRKRVEETLDLLGIADLRRRPAARRCPAGQQQRVAIGSVLTAHPRVLVLDEPTSALDPTAAEEVLAAVTRLVHDLGVTVVMAEHRMERVVQYADGVLLLPGDGTVRYGPPAALLADAGSVPPVVAPRPARRLGPAAAVRARRPAGGRTAAEPAGEATPAPRRGRTSRTVRPRSPRRRSRSATATSSPSARSPRRCGRARSPR